MLNRTALELAIRKALGRSRGVMLSGLRQSGKSTLAQRFLSRQSPNYFDVEYPLHAQSRPLQPAAPPADRRPCTMTCGWSPATPETLTTQAWKSSIRGKRWRAEMKWSGAMDLEIDPQILGDVPQVVWEVSF